MAIAISASVFGVAVIVIVVLLILWRVKSRQRKEEKFERTQSIRMSKTSLNKSRSTIAMLDDKYSVSAVSSRSRYGDSDEKSMMASAMSLASEKRRHDSRSDSNGYIGSRDRLHENGRAGSRERLDDDRRLGNRDDRYNSNNRRRGSQDRLEDDRRYGSRDRINDRLQTRSRDRLDEKPVSGPRDRLNKSDGRLDKVVLDRQNRSNLHRRDNKKNGTIPKEKENGSPQEKRNLVPSHHTDPPDTDAGYTDDGFSENEFDDFTTTADEGGKDGNDTDASTVINFHNTKKPPHVENEISSLHMKRSMNDIYQNHTFNSTPSVDLSGAKSLTSFHQPESPGDRPPTPPPPLPVDSYPSKSRNQSVDDQRSTPVPQPRQRPTPVPRSLQNSRENVEAGSGSDRSGPIDPALRLQNAPGRPPLHLSRESLNYLDNRREWLTDQVPEKQEDSEGETESETETETETDTSDSGSSEDDEEFTDKKDLPLPETYPAEELDRPHYRGSSRENLYDPKTYIPPPYEPPPYEAPSYGNFQDTYPNVNYNQRSRSRDNIPESFSTMDGGQGYDPDEIYQNAPPVDPGNVNLGFNRSRENIPEAMSNMDYLKDVPRFGASRENLHQPGYDNSAYVASPKHSPTEPMGSVDDVRSSRQSLDHLSRSRENLQGYPAHVNMGSRSDVSRSRQSLDHLSRSRENVHGSMASVHSHYRSRDNLGVLYLDGDDSQTSRPQPMETDI